MTPILLLLGAVSMAPAAADTLPVARAVRIAPAQRPSVDGRLSELAWSGEPAAAGFVQTAPRPGAPSMQRTEARVLYTDDAVYVGMRMYDTAPDSIAAQLARRDPGAIYSDWAHVVVDSYDDNRTAFRFSLNPRGVKRDVLHFNDTGEDATWDAVWDGAAAVDSLGWTAEFRIPLSQLRFSRGGPDGAQRWGINFGREIARADERAYWAPVLPNSGRFVSWAGELAGLSGLRPPRRLELPNEWTVSPSAVPSRSRPFGPPQNGTLGFTLRTDALLTRTSAKSLKSQAAPFVPSVRIVRQAPSARR